MSLSKSKCLYSNNCLHFQKCAVPLNCNRCSLSAGERQEQQRKGLTEEEGSIQLTSS